MLFHSGLERLPGRYAQHQNQRVKLLARQLQIQVKGVFVVVCHRIGIVKAFSFPSSPWMNLRPRSSHRSRSIMSPARTRL